MEGAFSVIMGCVSHRMALDAFIDTKGILALAMARAAGLAVIHVSHGCFGSADTVGENLGVAIGTFVCLQVEIMTERGLAGRFRHHVAERTRFHPLVALGAVVG